MIRGEIDSHSDEIIRLYIEANMTMLEIAKKFDSNKKSISRIIKNNGIEVKRYKRVYSSFYKQILSERQKEILIGSLLGDGCVSKHHEGINSCRYIETHSIDQIDYALWKYNEFKNFISNDYRIIDKKYEKSYKGSKPSVFFETMLNKEFVLFYEKFYPKGEKKVPSDIESILSPLSLAVWYMDDGSIDKKTGVMRISTYSFDENQINILIEALSNKYDLHLTKIHTEKGIVIQLCKSQSNKMINLIEKHILPSMTYKINPYNNPAETEAKAEGYLSEMIDGQHAQLLPCL